MRLPLDVPIDIGRDPAAEAARRELAKAVYAQSRPSVTQQIVGWVVDHVLAAIARAASLAPGGSVGLVVLVGLLVLVVVVVLRRTGSVLRSGPAQDGRLFTGRPRTAAEYRAAADTAAAVGDWDEAVRQRFRAVVRSLEERDILEPRPGRTADEAAAEASRDLPLCADALRAAAYSFDDVAYGGRAQDQQADTALRELERQLAAARPLHQPQEPPAALVPVR